MVYLCIMLSISFFSLYYKHFHHLRVSGGPDKDDVGYWVGDECCLLKEGGSPAWRLRPVIRKWKREDCPKFKACLSHITSSRITWALCETVSMKNSKAMTRAGERGGVRQLIPCSVFLSYALSAINHLSFQPSPPLIPS